MVSHLSSNTQDNIIFDLVSSCPQLTATSAWWGEKFSGHQTPSHTVSTLVLHLSESLAHPPFHWAQRALRSEFRGQIWTHILRWVPSSCLVWEVSERRLHCRALRYLISLQRIGRRARSVVFVYIWFDAKRTVGQDIAYFFGICDYQDDASREYCPREWGFRGWFCGSLRWHSGARGKIMEWGCDELGK